MNLNHSELWLSLYLDEHCTSPDSAGGITVQTGWATVEEARSEHAKSIASALDITSKGLDAIVNRLAALGVIGQKKTVRSLRLWITRAGQFLLKSRRADGFIGQPVPGQAASSIQRIVRAMIGSPGDTVDERQAITDAILRWNATNSHYRGISIEPVRWETHATPGLKGRPQGMINKELIPMSDFLVAVFRLRAGSPTGKEVSGTIEEIREFMAAKKHVLLYFYQGEAAIRDLDVKQFRTLDKFKKEIQQQGLIGNYRNISELREHLAHHLTAILKFLEEAGTHQIEPRGVVILRPEVAWLQLGFSLMEWRKYGAVLQLAESKSAKKKPTKSQRALLDEAKAIVKDHRERVQIAMIDLSIPGFLGNELMKLSDDFFNEEHLDALREKLMVYVVKHFNPTCYGALIIGWHLGNWGFHIPMYGDLEIAYRAAMKLDDTIRELSKNGEVSVHPNVLEEIHNLVMMMGNCKDVAQLEELWNNGTARIFEKFLKIYQEE